MKILNIGGRQQLVVSILVAALLSGSLVWRPINNFTRP
jgi:hypothetical protein